MVYCGVFFLSFLECTPPCNPLIRHLLNIKVASLEIAKYVKINSFSTYLTFVQREDETGIGIANLTPTHLFSICMIITLDFIFLI